ncbi:MAG TPA: EamA family transporter [Candidatus Sulfotelmatobacter sp.]|nr:EamA family transporter [Candidatus Sulfotelmatobacter sp.]
MMSFGFIAAYSVLIAVASVIEVPIARGFASVQLNLLIRLGSVAVAALALIVVHGVSVPTGPPALAGLGIGVLTGVGSIIYCLALIDLPLSLVVVLSNLYIVITFLLGITLLDEHVTALKIAGLVLTLGGVLLLANPPSSRYAVHSATSVAKKAPPARAFLLMGGYVVIIGIGAFLEKPALRGLDATQLNGLMAVAMTAVALVAFAAEGPRMPMSLQSLGGIGVGAMVGVASVSYFLGLRSLPVSVAAAASNSYIVIAAVLSTLVLHQPMTKARGGAIILTLGGVTLLALGPG